MSDRYGYIAIETLLNYCENQKDHSITPNDILRLRRENVVDLNDKPKIYLVTIGCYSDYRIEYACLDKKVAEKAALFISDDWESASVEEHEILSENEITQKIHSLSMWYSFSFSFDGQLVSERVYFDEYGKTLIAGTYDPDRLRINVCCDDRDKAFKIATDRRAKYYAEKLGL